MRMMRLPGAAAGSDRHDPLDGLPRTRLQANDVAAVLDVFDVGMNRPSWPVNRWLTAMVRLFRPQIDVLLEARDRRIRRFVQEHPDAANVCEDRRLEVTSEIDVSVEAQVAALDGRLRT